MLLWQTWKDDQEAPWIRCATDKRYYSSTWTYRSIILNRIVNGRADSEIVQCRRQVMRKSKHWKIQSSSWYLRTNCAWVHSSVYEFDPRPDERLFRWKAFKSWWRIVRPRFCGIPRFKHLALHSEVWNPS